MYKKVYTKKDYSYLEVNGEVKESHFNYQREKSATNGSNKNTRSTPAICQHN
jgi:hypothetical protein